MKMQSAQSAPSADHALHAALAKIVGSDSVVSHPDELIVYECDGFTIPRARPLAVVFPRSTEEVSAVVKLLAARGVPVMARGAGTGLAGGIVAVVPGVQVSLARMNRILELDLRNRCALVEAGVINWALSEAVSHSIYHYAPDPSSQRASTIGGNVATNAGGLHTLKYGVTVNHVLGLEVVLEDGSIHQVGGPAGHDIGPDIAGLICGTEGTLAIVTKIWCKLTPRPVAFRTALAIFEEPIREQPNRAATVRERPSASSLAATGACQSVADIIAAGILPAALEMMDGSMIDIVEQTFHLGFPPTAQALLLIEVDGQALGLDDDLARIEAICRKNGATRFESGSDEKRRAELWMARRKAFAAIGRVSPSYCTQDACVPRSKLPEVIGKLAEICSRHGLRSTNVFHAGDGNVHPALMYDDTDESSMRRALAASHEILSYCLSIGGTITGEHGVGIEKLSHMREMYSENDLAMMHRIRGAFVVRDTMNPYKTLPREGVEIDLLSPGRRAPQ